MTYPQLALLHLLPTAFMTGVIWFVQVVHYPLFAAVDAQSFRAYEERHAMRTTWVVLPPMVAELGLAAWLVLRAPTEHHTAAVAGAALVGAIWLSTFAVQVPCHARLASGFSPAAWRLLVWSNWLRTGMWSARLALASSLLW